MRPVTLRTLLWFGLLGFTATPAASQQPAGQRSYRIDDYFSTEDVVASSVTVAPDGQAVAFTMLRAANTQLTNMLLIPETRGDIWLQEAPARPVRNLTNGQADSSGWWNPQWSPDGQRLAFLSSRGGEVTVWAWERERNEVRQLSTDGVDFSDAGGCRWVDAQRLLCLALPEGERSTPLGLGGYYVGKAVERAEAAWAKAKRGELTASVVNSLEFKLPPRRLVLVDVTSGTSQTLATTQLLDMDSGRSPSWWLSPTGQAVASVRPGAAAYGYHQRQQMGNPASIDLGRLDGRRLRLSQPLPPNVVTSTLQWSPDGQALAFFALEEAMVHPDLLYYGGPASAREVRYPAVASKDYPGQLWRVDLARGAVERLPTGEVDLGQGATPPAFMWTARGELLFRAPRLVQGARPLTPAEPEWVVLGRDGRTRALVGGAQPLPEELEAIDGGAAFLGLVDGEVWRVDAGKGTAKHLMARLDPRVRTLQPVGGAKPTTHAVVSWLGTPRNESEQMVVSTWADHLVGLGMNHLQDYALLDLTTGATTPLRKPVPGATLVTYDGESQSALWKAEDRAGTFLWRRSGAASSERLVATNTFWKDVSKGEQRLIEYTTLNGERMKAKLVLPVGYQPGQRYPLVVDFDIGSTETNAMLPVRPPSVLPGAHEDVFAAAGYVYMFASWPSTSMDPIGRGNLLLGPNGIIPAAEKVVALGIADPERLFLFGASSAGYGVFALVTQTSRFKAAAAHAGYVDLITYPLTTIIHNRYTANPFDGVRMAAPYNSIQLPFWRNGENYRRNSPLSYVDRVQTPLLILHGDLDGVPITEPEMFFKALVMQRKPAQFVRYWGEGHGNQTPINFRDYFQRIFAWYDQWGDIGRDAEGNMVFEGDRVKSREGAPPLPAEAYARFPLFGPGGAAAIEAPAEH